MSVYPQPKDKNSLVKRLSIPSGSTSIYTCPSGFTAVAEKIIIQSSSANTVSLSISGTLTIKIFEFSLSAGDTLVDTNAYKLNESESITIANSSSVNLMIEVEETYRFSQKQKI